METETDTREVWVKVRYTDLEHVIRRLNTAEDKPVRNRVWSAYRDGLRRDPKYRFPFIWRLFK